MVSFIGFGENPALTIDPIATETFQLYVPDDL
jgi:hypothetical protein